MKLKLRQYGIAAVVSLGITLVILQIRSYPELGEAQARAAALSDAFFVPGVLFAGVAGLSFIADDGLFDIFSFSFLRMKTIFRIRKKDDDGPKSFYEYRMMKHEGKKSSLKFLFVIAGADLLAAVIFLLMSGSI